MRPIIAQIPHTSRAPGSFGGGIGLLDRDLYQLDPRMLEHVRDRLQLVRPIVKDGAQPRVDQHLHAMDTRGCAPSFTIGRTSWRRSRTCSSMRGSSWYRSRSRSPMAPPNEPRAREACGICAIIGRITSGSFGDTIAELPRSWLILGDAQYYRG